MSNTFFQGGEKFSRGALPAWLRACIQVTTLTCCNIQVKQRYRTMLAAATGNCAVTNVTYNENTCYVVTWTFYFESSMYLRRRQWLRQIAVMCHVACWFRSVAVLKFDQFYDSSFFLNQPDLFPRKCTHAKVIDLRNMVLWSIGFIANRHRIPPTKFACLRYCPLVTVGGSISQNSEKG